MGENGLRRVGDFPSTLADIRALMVAGSSWAKELPAKASEL